MKCCLTIISIYKTEVQNNEFKIIQTQCSQKVRQVRQNGKLKVSFCAFCYQGSAVQLLHAEILQMVLQNSIKL